MYKLNHFEFIKAGFTTQDMVNLGKCSCRAVRNVAIMEWRVSISVSKLVGNMAQIVSLL